MSRRWAAFLAPAVVVPILVGAASTLAPAPAGAATPSAPQPAPSPLSVILPLPSPLPSLNLLTTGGSATNPLAGLFPAETETIPQMQAALFADVNAERAAAGLGPVATNAWAQGVAMGHAQAMASARNIWHNYTGYVDVARQAINAYVDGENVGMAETLAQVDAALMASPTHKANILYPLFNTVGIGVAQDVNGYVYVTEDFADIRPAAAVVVAKPAATTAAHPAAQTGPAPAPAPSTAPLRVAPAAASPIVVPAPAADPAKTVSSTRAATHTAAAPGAVHTGSGAASRLAAVALATFLAAVAGCSRGLFRRISRHSSR